MFEPIVTMTFHEVIEEGESSFTIEVPKSYGSIVMPNLEVRHRQFYFSDLYFIPGFYKQKAAQLGLEQEENTAGLIDFQFRMSYTVSPDLYKNAAGTEDVKFEHGNTERAVDVLIKQVNAHFESTKPENIVSSVFFLDWIDLQWTEDGEDESSMMDPSIVIPTLTSMYYGADEYNEELFFNALEPSTRKLPDVNNFKFPSNAAQSPDLWANIRIRLNIAPNTKILVSTHTLLEQLGFTIEQLALPKDRRRYVFENPTTDAYITMVAQNPIKTGGRITGTTTTIFPAIVKKTFQSDWHRLTPILKDYDKNNYILNIVKDAFDAVSRKSNISVGIEFQPMQRQFRVEFPRNNRLSAVVNCDRDFSIRLGYEGRFSIDNTVLPVAVNDRSSKVDAEGQSRAIVYDTVMAMITMENSSSAITAGMDETLMACLYPSGSGTMSMTSRPPATNFFEYQNGKTKHGEFYPTLYPRSVYLPTVYSGDKKVPMKFNVWAVGKGSKKTPLSWKVPISVGGVLEGRV